MSGNQTGSKRRVRKRRRLLRRQGFVCAYCENRLAVDEVTLDHRRPVSKGGTYRFGNVVAACQLCNEDKADLPYESYLVMVRQAQELKAV